MKIVVMARMLNEKDNIETFLKNYEWADNILICDGGSSDGSLEIAQNSPKVTLTHYEKRINTSLGFFNPESMHMNKMIGDALQLNPDYLVMDDMDSFPNNLLFDAARAYFEEAASQNKLEIYARRYYMWGYSEYFPAMSSDNPPDNTMHSIWGWKVDHTIRGGAEGRYNAMEIVGFHPDPITKYFIPTPNCLLHYSWPNPKRVKEKMDRYASWNRPQLDPLESFGPAVPKEYFLRPKYPYPEDDS